MRKLFLILLLAMSMGGCQQAAFAQASPFNLNVFSAQSFTATGQTGATIQLNGLTYPTTVGSSYASGTITLTGVALTTVSFQVMGSSDNGATFYLLPVFSVVSPGSSPVTTVTATAAGLYQVNLAGITHIKLVTSGTFTATSVSLILTASPNASVSRLGGSGGIGTITSPDGTIDIGGTSSAATLDLDLASANTWTQGMTIQDGLTLDTLAFSTAGEAITFPMGGQFFEDDDGVEWLQSDAGIALTAGAMSLDLSEGDSVNTAQGTYLNVAGGSFPDVGGEFGNQWGTGFVLTTHRTGELLSSDNSLETQLGAEAYSAYPTPPAFIRKFGIGNVTTTLTNTNIKLVGAVTINGSPVGGGVASFNSRTGAVSPASGDYSAAEVTHAADLSASGLQTFAGIIAADGFETQNIDDNAGTLTIGLNSGEATFPALATFNDGLTVAAGTSIFPTITVDGVAISGTTNTGKALIATSTSTASWGWLSLSCQPGIGDGLNAIAAGTYLTTSCRNETGQTWTITAIRCVADSGSSTCNVTNGSGTGLLTAAITGTSTYANGTQSGTVTISSGDYLKITFVADGTSKQIGIDVAGTY